jgi:hypothetical protein
MRFELDCPCSVVATISAKLGRRRPGRRREQRDHGFEIAEPLFDRRRHFGNVHRRHALEHRLDVV